MKKLLICLSGLIACLGIAALGAQQLPPGNSGPTAVPKPQAPTGQKISKSSKYVPALKRYVTFTDRQAMKKGHPPRRMHAPLRGSWPAATLPIDWAKSLSFPILGNDQYGDCMYAAACHADQTMTGNVGTESTFNEQTVIQDYLRLAGGDYGLDDSTLIPAWQKGIGSNPQATIVDTLSIDPTNVQLCQSAMQQFGFIFFEFAVPDAWINSFQTGAIWDAPARADPANGHGVIWNGVDSNGNYKLQTWGSWVWITPAGVNECDPGAFVAFSQRWFNSQGYAPNGQHITQLAAVWQSVGGNPIPTSVISAYPSPSPTPPVPPTPPIPPTPGPTPPPPVGLPTLTISGPLPAGTYQVTPMLSPSKP